MKLLLGLIRPTAGRALLFGRPAGDRKVLARVGYLPEESKLFPWLTARETVVFFARLAGLTRAEAQAATQQAMRPAPPAGSVSYALGDASDEPSVDTNDPATWGKTGRNAPCPCGTGKKYKHCHGRLA